MCLAERNLNMRGSLRNYHNAIATNNRFDSLNSTFISLKWQRQECNGKCNDGGKCKEDDQRFIKRKDDDDAECHLVVRSNENHENESNHDEETVVIEEQQDRMLH